MVRNMLKGLIRRNVKAYLDDLLMKGHLFEQKSKDLEKVFRVLRRYKMKLNFTKCFFGMKG